MTLDTAYAIITKKGAIYIYRTITILPSDYKRCVDFSILSAQSQQQIEFGQRDTIPREVREIARDNLIGKMAEAAISQLLLEDFNMHLPVDYNVYPRGEWDNNDVTIFGWSIDIKSTRSGHFLLFEENKLRFRRQQNSLPHAIFMCRTQWNDIIDAPISRGVEIIGGISLPALIHQKHGAVFLQKGDYIPDTHTKLQSANYVVEFSQLTDISTIIPYMLTTLPSKL